MKSATFIANLALAASLASTACTQSPIDRIESMATETCACENATCVKDVATKYKDIKDNPPKDLSDEDKKRIAAAAAKAAKCAMKASVGGLGDLLKGK